MEADIPVVVLCGSAYQRGTQHGQRFAAAIETGIRRPLDTLGSSDLRLIYERAKDTADAISAIAPDVHAELRGIADGAGRPLLDIVIRSSFELLAPNNDTGCSALAVQTSQGVVVGQNWDAPVGSQAEQALFIHIASDGFDFATVSAYGGLGWVGCNRAGLAMVNNDLVLRSRTDGIPSQIARRILLATSGVDEALDAAKSLPHMAGRAYLIGDVTDAIASIEVSARHGVHVSRVDDFLAHTNHALCEDIRRDEDAQELAKQYPSSQARLHTINARRDTCQSIEDVFDILRNRDGTPDSVCKLTSTREPTQTAFSIVMDCRSRTLYLARGMPSASKYERLCL
ncbi:C45 family peptidase [Mesorhizobium sp. M1312]|uniref:C45 family peptidase n=1 Tax=unclassified Mesorhizobium TaxID=325217 RepID=UPI00333BC8CA